MPYLILEILNHDKNFVNLEKNYESFILTHQWDMSKNTVDHSRF